MPNMEYFIKTPKSLTTKVKMFVENNFIKRHTANIDVWLSYTVEKDGKIISKGKQKSKSFVSNMIVFILDTWTAQNAGVGQGGTLPGGNPTPRYTNRANSVFYQTIFRNATGTIAELGGTNSTSGLSPSGYFLYPICVSAGANDDSYGILVGSGTNAAVINDINLGTQITNSTLTHSAVTFGNASWVTGGSIATFTISRSFTNPSSTNTVAVNEAGLAASTGGYSGTTLTNMSILLIRDVLATTQNVPPNSTLTVTYTIQVSV